MRMNRGLWPALAVVVLSLSACGLAGPGSASETTSAAPPPASARVASVGGSSTAVSASPAADADTALYRSVRGAVVRIDSDDCDSMGEGSGFVYGPDLVVTVAHVVSGSSNVRITAPSLDFVASAHIIGLDKTTDLALLKTDVPIPASPLQFATQDPEQGQHIQAVGYPGFGSEQPTGGGVLKLHQHWRVTDDDGSLMDLSDLIVSNASINPGNSGGPWIDAQGKVVGLSESKQNYDSSGNPAENINAGVSGTDAATEVAKWVSQPNPLPLAECAYNTDATETESDAFDTLWIDFWDINQSDFESAYAQHDPATAPASGYSSFLTGNESSTITAVGADPDGGHLFALEDSGVDAAGQWLDVTFESSQRPDKAPDGTNTDCTIWHQRVHFSTVNGLQLIHGTEQTPGQSSEQLPCSAAASASASAADSPSPGESLSPPDTTDVAPSPAPPTGTDVSPSDSTPTPSVPSTSVIVPAPSPS